MSGGFFRGTSADQDTRFSNKQAKLMKSQKFAPELEHLVDMTKVKMDVMRPWIANRVTELIGFEDEVLINFIYGLLDGKEVNGKEVQISLTGFMERNTGKFMKELWSLLLSAQKNASGVPQQFLDAKEEETKKKKAESDRIATEIQRRKEKESQELEQERSKKMDRGNDVLKDSDTGRQPSSGYQPRARSVEEKDYEERNGSRQQSRVTMSPRSADRSSSPRGRRARSISKSFSNSRSHSDERHRSRSLSASRKRRERSSSSEMVHRFSPGRSLTPHRRPLIRRSPIHRSSYSSRRSSSRSRRRSPPPSRYRMRSPVRRRSRSPLRRRSRSPFWRRPRSPSRRSSPQDKSWSPLRHRSSSVRRRSPSPIRRNSPSPARYRSPSPMKRKYRRSPLAPHRRSRSPILQRSPSPIRRRSPSPIRRRSPSAIQRRSSSPIRRRSPIRQMSPSPIRRRSPIAGRRRSPTPSDHKSPSRRVWSSASPDHRSPSPSRKKSPKRQRKSPLQSPGERIRNHEKFSPVRHASPSDACQRPNSLEHQSQSDYWDQNDSHRKVNRLSSSPCKSPVSKAGREMILTEKRREKVPRSDCPSPPKRARGNKPHDDSSEISTDEKEANYLRGNKSEKMDHLEKPVQKDSQMSRDTLLREKRRESPAREKNRAAHKNQSHPNDIKINDQKLEAVPKLSRKVEQNERNASVGSGSEESDKNRSKIKDKRKNMRAERSDDETSFDSYAEERKEAKRRRKEEKRARKEKRRRRREEKHRRKEERHSEKKKLKATDTVSTPSDTDRSDVKRLDDDQHVRRRESHRSDMEETVSERKKLEIELREKAIQTLRAKKGISH